MDLDGDLHLDDACGDFDETQTRSVELSRPPKGALGRRHAQTPQNPIGSGVQKQAKLVGGRLHALGAVVAKMRLPGFYVVLSLVASAVDIFIETAGVAGLERGNDESRVDAVGPGFHPGDDPLDAAPALRAVEEFLVSPRFAG